MNPNFVAKQVLERVRALETVNLNLEQAEKYYKAFKPVMVNTSEAVGYMLVEKRDALLMTRDYLRAYLSLKQKDNPRFRVTRQFVDPNTLIVVKRAGQYTFMTGSLRGHALAEINTRYLQADSYNQTNDARSLHGFLVKDFPDSAPPPPSETFYQWLQNQQRQQQT